MKNGPRFFGGSMQTKKIVQQCPFKLPSSVDNVERYLFPKKEKNIPAFLVSHLSFFLDLLEIYPTPLECSRSREPGVNM